MIPVAGLSMSSFWYLPRLGLRVVVSVGLLLMATGYLCLRGLEVNSTYFDLAWPLLILATGIGLCTAPTPSAIVTAAPDEKPRVASAVNDTTREVGAALGIAIAATAVLIGVWSRGRNGKQLSVIRLLTSRR